MSVAVRYIVRDVPEAIAFYIERLGFALVEAFGDAMAIVTRDGVRLWLAGPKASAARPMPDGRMPVPGGWNRIVVEISDIDVIETSLRQAGINFRNEVLSGPGGSQVLIEDPSGNPIELFQPRRG